MLSFLFFISISFSGIIIVDSLIYSVSLKAEKELNIYGENAVNIKFTPPVDQVRIDIALRKYYKDISFSKDYIFFSGRSPYSDNTLLITGIDLNGIRTKYPKKNIKTFNKNVIIHDDDNLKKDSQFFLSGIPFKILFYQEKEQTDFLNSLGVGGESRNNYFIPLDTVHRLTNSNTIDAVQVLLHKRIEENDIQDIKKILENISFVDYNIYTSLNARETVDNVIKRFALLTNLIYIILIISAILSGIIICKRNFSSRKTEFALKIIHGIKQNNILFIVVIETVVVLLGALFVSLLLSSLSIKILTGILNTELHIRYNMVTMSTLLVFISCLVANVAYGRSFFKKNPIDIIKGYVT